MQSSDELRMAPVPISPVVGCLPFLLLFFLMCLLPMIIYDVGRAAMERLGLSPVTASLSVLSIFLGSLFNIPLFRIERDELQPELPFGPFGVVYPRQYRRVQSLTVIAVNVGGCLVPLVIAVAQILRLFAHGPDALLAVVLVSAVNIYACYRVARPMPGIGIMMPGFVSPLVAVAATWMVLYGATSDQRAATAFVAGVLGPVVGADLLHLREVTRTPVAVMSIGGAGTFDGIVLSGVLAALLA